MAVRRRYEVSQNGWKFLVVPENNRRRMRGKSRNRNAKMTVVSKPIGCKCLPPTSLYNVICEAFEEIPAFVCETITYDVYTFKRNESELDFYKEIAKPLKIKE